jgi:hypothetical protein
VTAFDKGNNESAPAMEWKVEFPSIVKLANELVPKFRLAALPKISQKTLYITYDIQEKGKVLLKFVDVDKKDIQILVNDFQDIGRYVIAVNPQKINSRLVKLFLMNEKHSYGLNLTIQE